MSQEAVILVFVYFLLAAAVTVYTAIKLSQFADVIEEKTSLGGALVGTLLLAGATSLPEVTTSVSAVLINNPDIAVGNMLGSNLFNLFILASFDFYFRRKTLYNRGSREHIRTASLGILLTLMVVLALILRVDYTIFGVGIDALLIAFTYAAGMIVISRLPAPVEIEENGMTDKEPEKQRTSDSSMTVKQAIAGFIIAAIVIMAAGSMLSIMGDRIAVVTGIGASFIGSFLIAAATSLPEGVSVYTALRLKNIDMAIGSILGSNMFNMIILAGSDIFYRDGAMLADVAASHIVTAIGISILSLVLILALVRTKSKTILRYSLPSLLIIIGYFVQSYLIFNGG